MTSAGRLFADERRPPDERSDAMLLRFARARDATLDSLERTMLRDEPSRIGEIAVAALLGYLDFRWPDRDWRDGRPDLSGWFDRFAHRPSMTTTRHIA